VSALRSFALRSRAMLLERMISTENTVCAISRFADISRPRYRLLTVLEGHDYTSLRAYYDTQLCREVKLHDRDICRRLSILERDARLPIIEMCRALPRNVAVFIIVFLCCFSILHLKSRNDAQSESG